MLTPHPLLRFALRLDAWISMPFGLANALFASQLASATHLPQSLILVSGLVCLPYGAALLWLARRAQMQRWAVLSIVLGNLLWADAALAIGLGWFQHRPSASGWWLLGIHAGATFIFALLQAAGWHRSVRLEPTHPSVLIS